MQANDSSDQEGSDRPTDCDCTGAQGSSLPCWPCYREGFETVNPNPSGGDSVILKTEPSEGDSLIPETVTFDVSGSETDRDTYTVHREDIEGGLKRLNRSDHPELFEE